MATRTERFERKAEPSNPEPEEVEELVKFSPEEEAVSYALQESVSLTETDV